MSAFRNACHRVLGCYAPLAAMVDEVTQDAARCNANDTEARSVPMLRNCLGLHAHGWMCTRLKGDARVCEAVRSMLGGAEGGALPTRDVVRSWVDADEEARSPALNVLLAAVDDNIEACRADLRVYETALRERPRSVVGTDGNATKKKKGTKRKLSAEENEDAAKKISGDDRPGAPTAPPAAPAAATEKTTAPLLAQQTQQSDDDDVISYLREACDAVAAFRRMPAAAQRLFDDIRCSMARS